MRQVCYTLRSIRDPVYPRLTWKEAEAVALDGQGRRRRIAAQCVHKAMHWIQVQVIAPCSSLSHSALRWQQELLADLWPQSLEWHPANVKSFTNNSTIQVSGADLNPSSSSSHILILSSNSTFDTIVFLVVMFIT